MKNLGFPGFKASLYSRITFLVISAIASANSLFAHQSSALPFVKIKSPILAYLSNQRVCEMSFGEFCIRFTFCHGDIPEEQIHSDAFAGHISSVGIIEAIHPLQINYDELFPMNQVWISNRVVDEMKEVLVNYHDEGTPEWSSNNKAFRLIVTGKSGNGKFIIGSAEDEWWAVNCYSSRENQCACFYNTVNT